MESRKKHGRLVTLQPNLHELQLELSTKSDLRIGIFSDIHFDSPTCHRDLFFSHLKVCDFVFIFGDFFDVMGTFRDPRSKPHEIRPEYYKKNKSYLDAIVEDAANQLKTYAHKILVIGYGNHETNIQRRHDTDILDRLCYRLRIENEGCKTTPGGYSGFIRIANETGNKRCSKLIYYHHGSGGNASRSKDILKSQIDAMLVPDADIIVSGHTHDKLVDPSNTRMRLKHNKIVYESMDWIKTGSYVRNDEAPGIAGFAVEKKFTFKKMGGYFLDFYLKRQSQESKNGKTSSTYKLYYDIIEAKENCR